MAHYRGDPMWGSLPGNTLYLNLPVGYTSATNTYHPKDVPEQYKAQSEALFEEDNRRELKETLRMSGYQARASVNDPIKALPSIRHCPKTGDMLLKQMEKKKLRLSREEAPLAILPFRVPGSTSVPLRPMTAPEWGEAQRLHRSLKLLNTIRPSSQPSNRHRDVIRITNQKYVYGNPTAQQRRQEAMRQRGYYLN